MANAGSFKKGEKKPNQGKRGPNKDTGLIRDMIATALNDLGGVQYLVECGNDPKTRAAFLSLIGKVMPVQVTGKDGDAIEHAIRVTFG